mmetsp:Transcript_91307/g.229524  ORF Transcript_91307/g.229524 Transcript_91307/m.229524 type:complete len:244 (+) Transcript_91307:188-919(+)
MAMLSSEVLADRNGLHVPDKAHRQRRRHHLENAAEIPVVDAHGEESARDLAHILHMEVVAERGAREHQKGACDAADQWAERADHGELAAPAREPLEGHEEGEPGQAQQDCHPLRLMDVLDDIPDCDVEELRLCDAEAQNVLQLARADDDGSPTGESTRHRVSQKGDQEAHLQQAAHNLQDTDNCSGQDRKADVLLRALLVLVDRRVQLPILVRCRTLLLAQHASKTCLNEQGNHGHGADSQLA